MKLTLRELFALTLIAALIVGWWIDHRRQAATIRKAQKAQEELANARLEAERNRVLTLLRAAEHDDQLIKARGESARFRKLLVDSVDEMYKAQSEPDVDSTAPVP